MSDDKTTLIQYFRDQIASLEEPETTQAEEEAKEFSGAESVLKLHQDHGKLQGTVDGLEKRLADMPIKSWVWLLCAAVAALGILALGAFGTWLRTLLDLLEATLPGYPTTADRQGSVPPQRYFAKGGTNWPAQQRRKRPPQVAPPGTPPALRVTNREARSCAGRPKITMGRHRFIITPQRRRDQHPRPVTRTVSEKIRSSG